MSLDRFIHNDSDYGNLKKVNLIEDAKYNKVLRKQQKDIDFDFDYTLNPYQGCSYGCMECYVQDLFPKVIQKKGGWGNFVEIRWRTIEILDKNKDELRDKKIFISTATDIWMPEAYNSGSVLQLYVGKNSRIHTNNALCHKS